MHVMISIFLNVILNIKYLCYVKLKYLVTKYFYTSINFQEWKDKLTIKNRHFKSF